MSEMDNDITASLAAIDKAAQQDEEESFTGTLRENAAGMVAKAAPSIRWMFNLPQNIGVGTIDAVLESADFLDQVGAAAEKNVNAREAARGPSSAPPIKPIQPAPLLDPEWRDALTNFRGFMAENAQNPGDVMTQKISQFAVPFTGWSKLVGGVQGANALSTAAKVVGAESATVATAFDPNEGRMADLLQQGRELEGRFGDALRFIAPDGSAANAAIEYLASREGDSDAEGRFKNVIDNLGMTAAFAALFKTGAAGLKAGRAAIENWDKVGTNMGAIGRAKQEGQIVFHGSQADFEQFDLKHINSGEGVQAYGFGTYVAENPNVAKSYRTAGGPRIDTGDSVLHAEELDIGGAQGAAKDLILEANRKGLEGPQAVSWMEKEVKTNAGNWGLRNRAEMLTALDLVRKWKMKTGKLYHVDIPDERISKMLDWDKPLSQQPAAHKALSPQVVKIEDGLPGEKFGVSVNLDGEQVYINAFKTKREATEYMNGLGVMDIVRSAVKDPRQISSAFRNMGFPGIKYLDHNSRKAGEGTRNYVVFDPADLKITKKE